MKFRQKTGGTWGAWQDLSIKALDSMEIGSIIAFAGDSVPIGWLICDGSSITQSAYPELYALIGGTLPNFKGRTLVGKDTSQTEFDTLLETGGSKELQAHTHTLNSMVGYAEAGGQTKYTTGYGSARVNTGITSDVAGSGTSGNLQPYAVINWIIKASQTTATFASVVNESNNSTTDTYSCDYVNDKIYSINEKVGGNIHTYETTPQNITGSDETIWNLQTDMTTTGKPLLIAFSITCTNSGDGSPNFQIWCDNTKLEQVVDSYPATEHLCSHTFVFDNISAGSHTIKIVGSRGNASSLSIRQYHEKSMCIHEL